MFPIQSKLLGKNRRKSGDLQARRESILESWQNDVCCGGELPEVEIISLLEEQIPRYRLRADTLTQFTGYENKDWYIPAPALRPDDIDLNLNPDQIREALNYFLLCSNRVSQMTKTYNDIEAVTRLLEEKEKDLELTARIGKELLAHNQKLETNVASLEAELKAANEKLTQLSHELVKKTELIQILTNDVDESGSEGGTPTSLRCINVELMQRRIGSLEEENKQLRREASQLASDTAECESAEQRLVQDIAQQLANSSMEVEGLSEELDRCKDENRLQQDQIASLTAKLADAEQKLLKLGAENETLTTQLIVSREVQAELASELADSKDRYNEVVALLRETQEQLRKQRKRGQPTVRGCGGGPLFSTGTPQPDSLASELLETSLYSELSTDSGIGNDKGASYRKVFETVRCASRNSNSSSDSPLHVPRSQSMLMSTSTTMSSGPRVSAFAPPASAASHLQSSRYYSSSAFPSLDSVGTAHSDYDSSLATTDTEESYPGAPRTGVPGVPGAADLEAAVRRLTPAEIIARRATLGAGPIASSDYDSHTPPNFLPYGCRTPDSIMSTGSSGFSAHSGAWRLPEKLQIVKPMEGSLTLAAWSQLATPTLGGLLEERPGVKIRGGRPLEDLGLEMYTLSDLEEDEEYENPGKSFQNTGSVYTLTNSTVLHPDDNTNVTSSVRGSQMCTAAPSRAGTAVPPTPVTRSRRNSTSTFSTTLGLAKLLNERGIRAVTPSTVCTPCSTFSPTATPCNSPDGSPRSSPPPSPPPFNPIKFPGFLTSGADFLRRTFSAEADQTSRSRKSKRVSKLALSRQEKKSILPGTVGHSSCGETGKHWLGHDSNNIGSGTCHAIGTAGLSVHKAPLEESNGTIDLSENCTCRLCNREGTTFESQTFASTGGSCTTWHWSTGGEATATSPEASSNSSTSRFGSGSTVAAPSGSWCSGWACWDCGEQCTGDSEPAPIRTQGWAAVSPIVANVVEILLLEQ
ncbi:trafficking kinesin-binding protein milt isoform X3 [Schistocerca nitens]|uniref:trafficking kinesin-binding protein milt isoform X3 n=1 Tax=Schistocerca nitens TaxID=7011 RepID=UPI00211813E8|nr:trafficking kinesin-binding protein milt isoform X3 [Schistocerca nitens]